jgi:hypothetical protein
MRCLLKALTENKPSVNPCGRPANYKYIQKTTINSGNKRKTLDSKYTLPTEIIKPPSGGISSNAFPNHRAQDKAPDQTRTRGVSGYGYVGPTIGDVSEKMFIDSKSTFNAAPLSYFKSNASFTRDGGVKDTKFWFQRKPFERAPTTPKNGRPVVAWKPC